MDERVYLEDLAGKPLTTRLRGYLTLSGPGYLQSAMTLGGGTVASCVLMGSLLGYELLWVQPLAIFLGYTVLAAVGKQATVTGEKPYQAFWDRLHPALAILWGASALIATVLWHIPQYSLTANGVIVLAGGLDISLDSMAGRIGIGVVVLAAACAVVYLYDSGARGLKAYELAVKLLVWGIVLAFAVAAISSGINWRELFLGFTGITFLQEVFGERGLPPDAIKPIVGGIAAAVGINMVFLYPYSLLKKNWGKEHEELAYFDLFLGMVIPFLITTTFVIVAVANTIGPAPGEVGKTAGDITAIVPVLESSLGKTLALIVVGFGMFAVGFSTIITHMLASGFIGCELFGFEYKSRARWWFSLLPAVGVIGVGIRFPFFAAVTASTLAALLMPASVVGFVILMNSRAYMGDALPRGMRRVLWNLGLVTSIVVLSMGGLLSLQKNWEGFQAWLNPPVRETAIAPAAKPGDVVTEWDTLSMGGGDLDAIRFELSHEAMGTDFVFRVLGSQERLDQPQLMALCNEAFDAIDELENHISSWKPESDTSRVNHAGAGEAVNVGKDLIEILAASRAYFEVSGGAFDVSIGPLKELWGFYRDQQRMPAPEELSAAVANVGMDKVAVDKAAGTVTLAHEGVRLDFGAVGKGFALDRAAAILRRGGVASALIHGGKSTLIAMGAPPGQPGWKVRIGNPHNIKGVSVDELELHNESLSTSAAYDTAFEVGETRYSHIFDPRTGLPVADILSATAIAPSGTASDALSTAFFVMGVEETEQYCRAHPEVRAIMVVSKNGVPQPVRINFG